MNRKGYFVSLYKMYKYDYMYCISILQNRLFTNRDVIFYIIVSYIMVVVLSSWESGGWGLGDDEGGGVDSWWCGESSILLYEVISWSYTTVLCPFADWYAVHSIISKSVILYWNVCVCVCVREREKDNIAINWY